MNSWGFNSEDKIKANQHHANLKHALVAIHSVEQAVIYLSDSEQCKNYLILINDIMRFKCQFPISEFLHTVGYFKSAIVKIITDLKDDNMEHIVLLELAKNLPCVDLSPMYLGELQNIINNVNEETLNYNELVFFKKMKLSFLVSKNFNLDDCKAELQLILSQHQQRSKLAVGCAYVSYGFKICINKLLALFCLSPYFSSQHPFYFHHQVKRLQNTIGSEDHIDNNKRN